MNVPIIFDQSDHVRQVSGNEARCLAPVTSPMAFAERHLSLVIQRMLCYLRKTLYRNDTTHEVLEPLNPIPRLPQAAGESDPLPRVFACIVLLIPAAAD